MPDLTDYEGREQGFVKHALIEKYLESFTIKIGSTWDEIVYLDAFAGPWGSKAADLSDTSFGIALKKLKSGAEVLRMSHRRNITKRAILIEKNAAAFQRLEVFGQSQQSGSLSVKCLQGAFVERASDIIGLLPSEKSFLFALIDPKGWTGLSMKVLAPLVRRRSSEVLVNVMTKFIRRFANFEQCFDSCEDFFGRPGVREIIATAPAGQRDDIVVREYCRSLRLICGFKHVSSCVVLEPDMKGIKYFMVFGTNSPVGIKVFKEAEAHAAKLQDQIKEEKAMGDQMALFATGASPSVSEPLREFYRESAWNRVEKLFTERSSVPYTEVFCKAMAMPLVTEGELLEYLSKHPDLQVRLDGERRKKPDLRKPNDLVVRIASA